MENISSSISLRQHERTHSFVYSYFKKRLSERLANGKCNVACTTERNCGYAIWYVKFHKLRSPCVEMNTPTINVCLSVLDSKDKRNSRFFQLKDVPRFLVWTAYCLGLYIASHKKFRNMALSCSFRMKPLQLNAEKHGQNHITRHRRSSLNGAGITD